MFIIFFLALKPALRIATVGNKLKKLNEMKNNDLNTKTTLQLKSKLNVNKTIAVALVIALTLFTAISIYGLIAKDNISFYIALFAVACTSWSFVPLPFDIMKKIKTELKLREN
jgi:hypothetical protein